MGEPEVVLDDRSSDKMIKYRRLKPYSTGEIRVLLLENVHPDAVRLFTDAGFQVECYSKALGEAELREKLHTVHALGIRSKTHISADLIKEAPCLLAIGCFCIGTNQVSLHSAASRGVNTDDNSRSVAELVIAEIISLARCLGDHNIQMHKGVWKKSANSSYEIRGKTLGIIGYGHIGSQLSVLAESMGMRVIFYDIAPIMPLGMARRAHSLNEVLVEADFVTLHVPETKDTINLIGEAQIKAMKEGSYLINASRGSVVDIEALKEALRTRKLAGAAIDVFPEEPESNGPFSTGLEGLQNLIMTPHIGGSTEEAQKAIGLEVAAKMIKFINEGSSLGSVNFPEVDLRMTETSSGPFSCRVLNVHNNVPGVLKKINDILADFNIDKQISDSQGPYAYMMADVSTSKKEDLDHIFEEIYKLPDSISTRIVY